MFPQPPLVGIEPVPHYNCTGVCCCSSRLWELSLFLTTIVPAYVAITAAYGNLACSSLQLYQRMLLQQPLVGIEAVPHYNCTSVCCYSSRLWELSLFLTTIVPAYVAITAAYGN